MKEKTIKILLNIIPLLLFAILTARLFFGFIGIPFVVIALALAISLNIFAQKAKSQNIINIPPKTQIKNIKILIFSLHIGLVSSIVFLWNILLRFPLSGKIIWWGSMSILYLFFQLYLLKKIKKVKMNNNL